MMCSALLADACDSECTYKTKLMVQHPCIALDPGAAICAWILFVHAQKLGGHAGKLSMPK